MEWSPEADWFALIDEFDGHMHALYIYHIVDSANELTVDLAYRSPDRLVYDTYWDMESWDLPNDSAVVKLEYRAEDEWGTKYLSISLANNSN